MYLKLYFVIFKTRKDALFHLKFKVTGLFMVLTAVEASYLRFVQRH